MNSLDRMMERTMATPLSCLRCATTFTFQQGGFRARDLGIKDQVVACPRCHAIYDVDVRPGGIRLTADVTARYGSLAPPSDFAPKPLVRLPSRQALLSSLRRFLLEPGASKRRFSRGGVLLAAVSALGALAAFGARAKDPSNAGTALVYACAAAATLAWAMRPNRRRLFGCLAWIGGFVVGVVLGLLLLVR